MICYQLSLNMWVGVVVSLLIALAIGFVNGYLVVRTGIPSFLITLSTFFILQGLNLGVTKMVTGTVATPNTSGLDGFSQANAIFASDINLGFMTLKVTVLWWFFFVAVASWLLRTGRATGSPLRRQPGQRPRGQRARAQGQDRPVHGRLVPCPGSSACTCSSTSAPCRPASASATSSSTSLPRSSAARC